VKLVEALSAVKGNQRKDQIGKLNTKNKSPGGVTVLFERKTCSYPEKVRDCGPDGVFAVRSPLRLNYPITSTLPRYEAPFLLNDIQKKAKARTSMLWRAGAFGGLAGSLNDVCGVNRARPSVWES
jgi:hypothetical protein